MLRGIDDIWRDLSHWKSDGNADSDIWLESRANKQFFNR